MILSMTDVVTGETTELKSDDVEPNIEAILNALTVEYEELGIEDTTFTASYHTVIGTAGMIGCSIAFVVEEVLQLKDKRKEDRVMNTMAGIAWFTHI